MGTKDFFAKTTEMMKNSLSLFFFREKAIKNIRKTLLLSQRFPRFARGKLSESDKVSDLSYVSRFPISASGTVIKKGSPR